MSQPPAGQPPAGPPPTDEPPAGRPPVHGRHRMQHRYQDLRTRADETGKKVQARAEDLRVQRPSVRTAFRTYEYDRRRGGALLAGGLAYRLFLWLLPAALFFASLVSIIGDVSSKSPTDLAHKAGLGASLAALVGRAAAGTGKGAWFLLFFAAFLTVWAGMSAWKALRLVATVAWQVPPTPAKRLLRASAVFCGVGIVLLASPLLFHLLSAGPLFTDILAHVLTVGGLVALALWLMMSLPHPDGLPWREFLPGAILFGVGVEILRIVTAVYFVWKLGRTDLYGSLGVAAIFMAWLYLMGRIVVAALALNATRWLERQPQAPPA